jgi:hypothetical protein
MNIVKTRSFWLCVIFLGLLIGGSLMSQQQISGGGAVVLSPGSNIVGKVGIDQTTPGTTNGVQLTAGSAIAGNFRVDQTTPGTTNGVSLAQVGSTTVATGNGVTGAGVQRVTIASDQTAFTVFNVPKTSCGSTAVGVALQAVPLSATLATSAATTCVQVIVLNNTTAGALTVTITDNQGTPINDLLTFSIPAFSQVIQPLWGLPFTTGVKWTASGSGVTGGMTGYQ